MGGKEVRLHAAAKLEINAAGGGRLELWTTSTSKGNSVPLHIMNHTISLLLLRHAIEFHLTWTGQVGRM
jgi:hypothetical protein